MGDENEEASMGDLWDLGPLHRGGGRPGRLADQGRYTALFPGHYQASSFPAKHRVSHRMGDPVRPDGHWRGPGLSGAPLRSPVPQPAALPSPARFQLLLEHHFLSVPEFRLCPCLAGSALGPDPVDAAVLPSGGLHRRVAASPVSPLGDLCGLSQLGCLAAQSTLKKAPGS